MSEMAQMRDTQQAHTKILMLLQTQAEQTTKGIATIIGLLTPPEDDEATGLPKRWRRWRRRSHSRHRPRLRCNPWFRCWLPKWTPRHDDVPQTLRRWGGEAHHGLSA